MDRPFSQPYKFAVMTTTLLASLTLGMTHPAAAAPAKLRWASYKSTILSVMMTVPAAWVARKSPVALGFRSPGYGETAAVGIMKSADGSGDLEQAADKLFSDPNHPADWSRTYANVAGLRAIKIIGSAPKHPERKMVQYLVEAPNGRYLLQCFAPVDMWSAYGPLFARIISQVQFL